MPGDYSIIDWVIDSGKVNYGNVLGNKQAVSQAMQDLNDKRMNTFMRKADWLEAESLKSGRSLNKEIETNNKEWIDTFYTYISNNEEPSIIQDRLNSEKGRAEPFNYEQDSIDKIQAMITDYTNTFTQRTELSRLFDEISSAKTKNEMPDISSGEIKRKYGEEARKEFSGLIAEKNEEFTSLTEDFEIDILNQLSTATVSDLSSIENRIRNELPSQFELRDGARINIEDSLLREVENRRRELEEMNE